MLLYIYTSLIQNIIAATSPFSYKLKTKSWLSMLGFTKNG